MGHEIYMLVVRYMGKIPYMVCVDVMVRENTRYILTVWYVGGMVRWYGVVVCIIWLTLPGGIVCFSI